MENMTGVIALSEGIDSVLGSLLQNFKTFVLECLEVMSHQSSSFDLGVTHASYC